MSHSVCRLKDVEVPKSNGDGQLRRGLCRSGITETTGRSSFAGPSIVSPHERTATGSSHPKSA